MRVWLLATEAGARTPPGWPHTLLPAVCTRLGGREVPEVERIAKQFIKGCRKGQKDAVGVECVDRPLFGPVIATLLADAWKANGEVGIFENCWYY